MASTKISALPAAVGIDGTNDYLPIVQSGVTNRINRTTFLGITGAPLGTTDSQAVSNKTLGNTNTVVLKDTLFTLQDDGDATKQVQFQLSGITTGNTRTLTLPNASVTLASLTGTETFTNKTITSPTITGGTIDNATVTIDSILGHTTSTIVTVANLQISNGVLNSANAVTATSIAAGAVQPQALVAGTGSGWTLQSYTPTWTNATVGNGTNTSNYIQIGKIVYMNGRFTLGSTSSVGSNPTLSLPVAPSSHYNTASYQNYIGTGVVTVTGVTYDMRISSNPGTGASNGQLIFLNVAGTYAQWVGGSSSIPGTWANLDTIQYFLVYEAA